MKANYNIKILYHDLSLLLESEACICVYACCSSQLDFIAKICLTAFGILIAPIQKKQQMLFVTCIHNATHPKTGPQQIEIARDTSFVSNNIFTESVWPPKIVEKTLKRVCSGASCSVEQISSSSCSSFIEFNFWKNTQCINMQQNERSIKSQFQIFHVTTSCTYYKGTWHCSWFFLLLHRKLNVWLIHWEKLL